MLIPQFSLRWLLALTALCAGVSLILSFAFRGQNWAIGMATALGSILGLAVLYVTAFLGAWLLTQLAAGLYGSRQPVGQSPFAKIAGDSPFPATATGSSGMVTAPANTIAPGIVVAESAMNDSPPPISG